MKKFYLIVCLLIFTTIAFSQISKEDSVKKDTTQRSNVTVASATNISVLIPQLTPKSPNVAALGRYGEAG